MIPIKTLEEIKIMQAGGQILAEILKKVSQIIKPGLKTKELDSFAEELIRKAGVKPAFKGYQGFPNVLCTSINEEIVHVIPSERKLKEGDIISLDLGIFYRPSLKFSGFYLDSALTVPVGKVSPEASRLIRITHKALKRGIRKLKPGNHLGDVSNAIQRYVESQGFNVIRDLVGHGVGKKLHEEPAVPNFGQRRHGVILREGMVLALEPMVSAGDWHITQASDGYGFKTMDNSLSAHFEDSIAITKNGPLVLTK